MRALAAVSLLVIGCGHHGGATVIDAPVDAAIAADAPVDAAPSYCAPTAGTQISAPVWATITGEPIYVTAPRGDPRVFVVDKGGTIQVLDRDGTNPRVFLDLRASVDALPLERGLLGLAFAPDFATSHRFYVDFTRADPSKLRDGDVVIAELQVSATDPDAADPASRRDVLVIDHHQFSNHNGGTLAFGPDGDLYISVGDGGGSGGVNLSPDAQDPGSLLGKLLRIDPHATATAPYTIPAGNPFVGVAGARPEVWDLGLRNPYRFGFDAATGALFIADVGGQHFEEIDLQPPGAAGLNYGWPLLEGPDATTCTMTPGCDPSAFVTAIATHTHRDGWCAIMGGAVYRGACFPDLVGRYFYADYCATNLVWFDAPTAQGAVTPAIAVGGLDASTTSVSADGLGELYVTAQGGTIRRITAAP